MRTMCFRLFSLTMLISVLGCVGFAQAHRWKIIENTEDRFSLAVPHSFEYKRSKFLGRFTGGRGEFNDVDRYLYAFVDRVGEPDQVSNVDRYLSENRASSESIGFGSKEGSIYRFEDEDGYHHVVIRLNSDTRLYAFHGLSKKKDDKFVEHFVKSLRIGDPQPDNHKQNLESENRRIELEYQSDRKPVEKATPQASESLKAQQTTSSLLPNSTVSRQPMMLSFKQKAAFPEFARFYMIEGHVTLRVMFMFDGTIGEVKVIRKLPFGLVSASTAAAKQMRFTPETLDGKAVSISRPVSYTFDIY